MLFSYGSGRQRINSKKNAGESMAISIALAMQRYDAGRIARQSIFRASLEATGCFHRASASTVSPRRPPWSKNSNKIHKTLTKHSFQLATTVHFNRQLFVRISYPKTDPLLSSSMRQASCKYETPRLELKSSAKFLAIKHCQRTKFGKVISLARSSIFKWAHICAHRG